MERDELCPKAAQVRDLITGVTTASEEDELLQVFRDASADELNTILKTVDTENLFDSVDDRLLGPDNRSALVTLLGKERIAELGLEATAAVIYGMQAGLTTPLMQQWVRNIFLHHRGVDLTALKNQINMRTDQHDLEGLIFADIDDTGVRAAILQHFAAEADSVAPREAKVLSDIDDTAIARIHEKRYPLGTVYPGVLALYQALDKGPTDTPRSEGDLTFVTARPGDAFGLIENHTRSALRKAGVSTMSVLAGGFTHLTSKEEMAEKKIENIGHYAQIFPEYDMVFIGDSGQGDVIVGQRMYDELPGKVRAVFIHDVVDTPEPERARHRAGGIHFFDTYLGAAALARELELISDAGVTQLVKELDDGLADVRWESAEQESTLRALIERDRQTLRPGRTLHQSPEHG